MPTYFMTTSRTVLPLVGEYFKHTEVRELLQIIHLFPKSVVCLSTKHKQWCNSHYISSQRLFQLPEQRSTELQEEL